MKPAGLVLAFVIAATLFVLLYWGAWELFKLGVQHYIESMPDD